jgi:mannose-6-phosphate isomerase-like protein (cupin superfamily)
MAGMKTCIETISRRNVLLAMPVIAAVDTVFGRPASAEGQTVPPGAAQVEPVLASAQAFPYGSMHVRTMANGGESRDIVHGALKTGEVVNLHQSMQVAGTVPNPMHVIQHSEFIMVWEGQIEFQREDAEGKVVSDTVGPGGVLYVALGTKHTLKNVGDREARYFVVAIGGDAK